MLERLKQHAQRQPDHVAIDEPEGVVTYGQLFQSVQAVASLISGVGVRAMAIDLPNGSNWIIAHLACLQANIPQVPIPPFFTAEQREHALRDAGVNALLAAATDTSAPFTLKRLDRPAVVLPKGTALITYTSGSTGNPKGVCLSREGMERVSHSLLKVLGASMAKRHLSVLPLAVLLEQVAGLYTALLAGGTYIIRAEPLPIALNQSQATSCILVPELLKILLQCRGHYSALRFAAVGGAKVDASLLEEAALQGFPVYQGYGLSESASVIAVNTPRHSRLGTVGQLLPHIRLRVAADGEIVLHDPAILGYAGGTMWQGDYATGDIGSVDESGYLTIEGRKKNILITSYGRNISPEWPESMLLAQPEIAQAMVYGDAHASLSALLVPAPGVLEAAIEKAVAHANALLPEYAQISNWKCRSPFSAEKGEVTGTGRIRRNVILQTITKDQHHEFLRTASA